MEKFTEYDPHKERLIAPVHDELVYCGRIDDTDPDAPVFVQPGSFVRVCFTGSAWIKAVVVNKRRWYDSYAGVLADHKQYKIRIEKDDEPVVLTLAEGLEKDLSHEVTFFKRMDQCHSYAFLGFLVEHGARVEKGRPLPRKKLEFYGDSVTAGEVTEALDYVKCPDPPHNGEFSNSYFSFAWATARRLHARAHLVAQGGIALLDGSGYYEGEEGKKYGMESCWDKVYFYPETTHGISDNSRKDHSLAGRELSRMNSWNFARYTPHVVVVAIGQNDSFPADYMREEPRGDAAQRWREHYKNWIRSLRRTYPGAWIVLTTTILHHHPAWDRSIGRVCAELEDPKIVHFLFEENGRGTPGHVRVPEAMNMALELAAFIEKLPGNVWK